MTSPYKSLPSSAFWRPSVAEVDPLDIAELWTPKFQIHPHEQIATAGSCFAQHFSRALVKRGYTWMNTEPAPALLDPKDAEAFNYGIFSFRTGNIYTARSLLQWLELAFGAREPITDTWERNGRFYDPLRPAIEPDGFKSEEELFSSREATLHAIRKAVTQADVFVFTMGLTESWQNTSLGYEYAICPGTNAGDFDARRDRFENQSYETVQRDMTAALALIRRHNPDIRVLLTVSPVPLTATASGEHVLVATSHSKAVLRTVAGALSASEAFVDYFPSYEIITSPAFEGRFYSDNKRSVRRDGVSFVMKTFFSDQVRLFGGETAKVDEAAGKNKRTKTTDKGRPKRDEEFVRCEEEMLDAFAKS